MQPTHYQILGVEPGASSDQIRKAYRALAKLHHPDVSSTKDAAKRFARIAEAYEVLSDAKRRHEYDRTLAARAAQPSQRPVSDFRQGHYAWVSVAAPRGPVVPDISEVDDLYRTFFGGARRSTSAGKSPHKQPSPQQAPNSRAPKKPPRKRSSG